MGVDSDDFPLIGIFTYPFCFFSFVTSRTTDKMTSRIVNYNKRLFGPGPVARVASKGISGYYARMAPLQGFTMAAVHGTALGFAVSFIYKFTMGDPDTKTIKQYYEENPPR